jgi:FKBP-type peptidyl-prolyl cis-trans isomerase FkpA
MKGRSETPWMKVAARTLTATMLLGCATAFGADAPAQSPDEKNLYAIGVSMSRSLSVFSLTPAEFDSVRQGLVDAQAGRAGNFDLAAYSPKIQALAKERRKASGQQQVSAGKEFLERAAKEKGAVKTDSGLVYLALAEGKGEPPKASDSVKVNYRGTLIDGKEFDSSYKRGKPLEFRLDNVIKCWIEGVQKMRPGGKAKLVCPPELAYGENGAGELILPGATLAFEVELLEVIPSVKPAAPSALAVPSLTSAPAKK